jgi:quaternary ammonium compound-resistance protein SugE
LWFFPSFGLPPLRDWIASFDISPTDEKVSTPIQRIVSQFLDEVERPAIDERRDITRRYAWTILVVGGVFETGFSIGLKYSEGFTRLWPSVATAIMIVASLFLVGVATRSLPLGTAYAVWTGIGAVGTVGLGIVLFGESAAASRLAYLGLIVSGILGLKLLGE